MILANLTTIKYKKRIQILTLKPFQRVLMMIGVSPKSKNLPRKLIMLLMASVLVDKRPKKNQKSRNRIMFLPILMGSETLAILKSKMARIITIMKMKLIYLEMMKKKNPPIITKITIKKNLTRRRSKLRKRKKVVMI